MAETVNIHHAKTHFSKLIERDARRGGDCRREGDAPLPDDVLDAIEK
jgi:hypothetical protein